MTTPGLGAPEGAITGGDIAPLNGLSESAWRASLSSQVVGAEDGSTGGWNAATAIFGLFGGRVTAAEVKAQEIQTGITAGWVDGDRTGADDEVFDVLKDIREKIGTGGLTRRDVLSTQLVPRPESGWSTVMLVGVAAGENGGNGGRGSNVAGGLRGRGGGHKSMTISASALTGIHVTIGANGAPTVFRANSAGGAVLMECRVGAPGAIGISGGYAKSESSAGDGGSGGASGDLTDSSRFNGKPGVAGLSTPDATGGNAGGGGSQGNMGGNGIPGGSASWSAPIPCGGAGGGGGGGGGVNAGIFDSGNSGGSGGSGGFPGGGGGGGGSGSAKGDLSVGSDGFGGPGGPGAPGVASLYY